MSSETEEKVIITVKSHAYHAVQLDSRLLQMEEQTTTAALPMVPTSTVAPSTSTAAPSLGKFKIPKLVPKPAAEETEQAKAEAKTAKRRRQRARKVARAKEEGHRAPGQEKGGRSKVTPFTMEFPMDVKKWTNLANFRYYRESMYSI